MFELFLSRLVWGIYTVCLHKIHLFLSNVGTTLRQRYDIGDVQKKTNDITVAQLLRNDTTEPKCFLFFLIIINLRYTWESY